LGKLSGQGTKSVGCGGSAAHAITDEAAKATNLFAIDAGAFSAERPVVRPVPGLRPGTALCSHPLRWR